jgi:hypothetical protein
MEFGFLRLLIKYNQCICKCPRTDNTGDRCCVTEKPKETVKEWPTCPLGLLLHPLQRRPEQSLNPCAAARQLPTAEPLAGPTSQGKAASARFHFYGPGSFSPFPGGHQSLPDVRCPGPDWPCPPGSSVRCCASGRWRRRGSRPRGASAAGSTGTWHPRPAVRAPRPLAPAAIGAGPQCSGPQSHRHRPLHSRTRAQSLRPLPPPLA